jgi:hypothetical protein
MLVSDVINLAKISELRQLAVKDDTAAVLAFINLGMLELYKRFSLKQEEAIVTMRDGKSEYHLNGTDPDVEMVTFQNFLLVSECWDESGTELTLNDENDPLAIMTPSYNSVQVPNVANGEKLSIIYRTSVDFATALSDDLLLPPQLLEALLYYVGFKGHSAITVDLKGESNSHYIRFEQSCNRVVEKGLVMPDDLESYMFENRGFI